MPSTFQTQQNIIFGCLNSHSQNDTFAMLVRIFKRPATETKWPIQNNWRLGREKKNGNKKTRNRKQTIANFFSANFSSLFIFFVLISLFYFLVHFSAKKSSFLADIERQSCHVVFPLIDDTSRPTRNVFQKPF